jgi:hypothetical protein
MFHLLPESFLPEVDDYLAMYSCHWQLTHAAKKLVFLHSVRQLPVTASVVSS